MILKEHPICNHPGCHAVATEADHIVPLDQGGGWELENGQGLCKPCHSRKTRYENGKQTTGAQSATAG
jgi:5-methylcytosine-specific restriction protein A